ncbi:MAG: ATPase [Candidatus Poribacteria bacterium]|nr:ATPase [Candidatus Poribacteria bacterium]
MLLADMGTQYTKIFDSLSGKYWIIRSIDWSPELKADIACGHNCKHKANLEVNELVALAKGAKSLIKEPTFILVDVGSRDIKSVKFKDGEYVGCDWNYMCGAMAGFTIELLGNHFGIDYNSMEVAKERLPIMCGVLGMGELFDRISDGISPEKAIAMFIKGLAKNIYDFSGKEDKIYLSGGLCENKLFVNSFPCEVIPLGRFIQVEGLKIEPYAC